MELIKQCYQLWINLLTRLQTPFLLAIRLYWGWSFVQTGWGKLQNLSKVTEYFQGLGIPLPQANALLAASTEILGGLLLLLGLGARVVTVPLLFLLGVAYATAESDALKAVWSDPDKFTSATPFLFALACLIVLLFGPGAWSLDSLLACRKKNRE